jgi:hypothetical protein
MKNNKYFDENIFGVFKMTLAGYKNFVYEIDDNVCPERQYEDLFSTKKEAINYINCKEKTNNVERISRQV